MKRTALLIMDMQKAYLEHQYETKEYQEVIAYINYVAGLMRQANQPVIIVRDVEGEDGEQFQVVDDIKVEDTDIGLVKHYQNAFWKTELEELLKDQGVDFVIICGTTAEFCVLSTYNGAVEREITPNILQHGVLASHPDNLLDFYRHRNLISYTAVKHLLA